MITLAGTVVGASWPIFLAAIPIGVGALVYLFRAKGTGQPRVTSSLFLLSRLPQYTPNRRRFVPPLRFWLELALALVLALAASGIMSAETGARVAVVVDTSKSMGARLSADETRLEAAVRIAAADVSQAPADTRFTVLSAGRTLVVRSRRDGAVGATRVAGALDALKALEPTYDEDTIGATVSELISRGEYDSVWLYTDRTVNGVEPQERVRVTTIPFDPDQVRNVWISALVVRSSEQPRIEVTVSRVGGEKSEVSVTTTCAERGSGESFTVPPVTKLVVPGATTRIELREFPKEWSYCQVSLQGGGDDLLPNDDTAWVVLNPEKEKIGVVSPLSIKELGLDRVPYGTSVVLGSENLESDDDVRGIIYHRSAPNVRPTSAALVAYPNTGAKLWGAAVGGDIAPGVGGTVEITRWNESHPIAQYLRPSLLALPTARVLECPSGAEPIVHSTVGPIVCAGEDQGQRYVVVGFEIFPFDGLQTPTLSIFTLNVLQWLLRDKDPSGVDTVQTGVVRLPVSDAQTPLKVTRVAPRSEELVVNGSASIDISEPGVLSVASPTTGKARFLAIQAISDQESDLLLQAPAEISTGVLGKGDLSVKGRAKVDDTVAIAGPSRDTRHYDGVLAWCALFVLLIDLVRRIVTRSGWGERV